MTPELLEMAREIVRRGNKGAREACNSECEGWCEHDDKAMSLAVAEALDSYASSLLKDLARDALKAVPKVQCPDHENDAHYSYCSGCEYAEHRDEARASLLSLFKDRGIETGE